MEKLVLIDGNSLINRAFYATPLLTTKDGVYTNAVYGFMTMLVKMFAELKPTHLTVAFDVKAPTFRHEMYGEYKGTRKPMPNELRPQIDLLKEVLSLMKINTVEKAGIEADDIIGTIAKSTKMPTVIITGDKDSFQLVDEETEVYFTRRGLSDLDVYDINNFEEKTGITPPQIIDLKALMGDSSDNIPGVPGIGEKTALNLLHDYGTVENIYDSVDNLSGKLKEKIVLGKESCFMSKTLATIDTKTDIDTDLSKMKISLPFGSAVRDKFNELEFRTLAKKDELFEKDIKTAKSTAQLIEVNDFSFLSETHKTDKISIVLGKEVHVGINEKNYKIKIKENFFGEGCAYDEAIFALRPIFESNARLIVFGKKQLMHELSGFGVNLSATVDDVSVMKYLADFTGREEKIEDVFSEYGLSADTPAASLLTAYEILAEKLKSEGEEKLYKEVELPLVEVLYSMERSGFKIDLDVLEEMSKKYEERLKDLEGEIHSLAGEKFNVNSPRQLGVVLFEKLMLGRAKKNKTGYSTNAEVLESLQERHPIVPLILKYRQLQKLKSTYIDGFRPLVDKSTGLIHTSFNQLVTSTGRLSSKEPNLQNIPIRDEEGKEIRKFFVPRDESHVLVGADYSQIELRLLAHFSGCPELIEAYNENKDIHTITASQVFKVPLEKVTKEMRRSAKAVNFGIIYGISDFGLAKNLKISVGRAKEYINSYFESYSDVKKYMENSVAFANEHGYALTLLGRKRYIRELKSENKNLRAFGERAAMNMPLQGSSADIIKLAMCNVYNRLKRENLKSELILQVHDELIIDALKTEREKVEKILVEEMENAVKLKVPLTVETEIGETLYDAK